MPKRKQAVTNRLNRMQAGKGLQLVLTDESDFDGSDDTSHPIASSSAVTLDHELHTTHTHAQPRDIPLSDDLAGGLDNLTIEARLGDDIVLEDPPEETKDLVDNRNPPSLAEPEENGEEADDDGDDDEIRESSDRTRIPWEKVQEMAAELNDIIESSFHGFGKRQVCTLGKVVLTRLQFMFGTLNLMVNTNLGLIDASVTTGHVLGRGKWAARQAHIWIRAFQKEGRLPTNVYGTWNGSVIEDEDLSAAIQVWLRDRGKYVQARDVIDFFGTEAAKRFSNIIDAPPSLRTAQRWMNQMGYTWMKERLGQFADGHERDDVKDYRMNFYVPEWTKLERRMQSWDDKGNEISPELKKGERVVVVWFHDESTFYAHDRRLTRWVHKTETASLHKKGKGVLLMVADFISADYGWLRSAPVSPGATPIAGEHPDTAQVIFHAGTSRDGWFGTSDVVKQLSQAISIIKRQYPNEDHVFIFDNATIHTKLPSSTPNVNKMTLGPSKKVKGEDFGPSGEKFAVEYAPVTLPDGTIQKLYHPLDHPIEKLQGAFKGMALILEERGIPNAQKLKLVCPTTGPDTKGCPPGSTNCCARHTMMNQPDIIAQKSILQIQAEAKGFSVMYLPKYHCELNPIEQCWGAAKRVYRDFPPSSLEADLERNMLDALKSVNLESIRRFAARSQRFVHAYSHGLSGSEAAWAAKKYRGHRIIPSTILETMDNLD